MSSLIAFDEVEEVAPAFMPTHSENLAYPTTPLHKWSRQYIPAPAPAADPSSDSEDDIPFSKVTDRERSPSYILTPAFDEEDVSMPSEDVPMSSEDVPFSKLSRVPAHHASNPPKMSAVPRPIPKEIQTLVDAYIHHTPVLCIASNACMTESWSVTLPSEVEFAYLGFHTVVGVQVN
jgi:hypothetical protein